MGHPASRREDVMSDHRISADFRATLEEVRLAPRPFQSRDRMGRTTEGSAPETVSAMSKRTPATSKTPSDAPKTRSRAVKPAPETTETTPKAPRTRRKAQPVTEAAVAADTAIAAAVIDVTRTPTHEEIARRAYFIALERGFSSDPLADWLTAERELTLA
jgi:hypothetical protein